MRLAWRLDQLCGLGEAEAMVQGDGAPTDQETIERLPTLLEAALVGRDGTRLGHLADAAVELRSGRIVHYLVSRSDPRLPGSSRWRLTPDRILDQEPGQVMTALEELDALPLARASVRQEFLRRSRRWREQFDQETGRWRDQFQQVGDRLEDRLEGWLEEAPWDPEEARQDRSPRSESSSGDPVFDDWQDDDWREDDEPVDRPVRGRFDDEPVDEPVDEHLDERPQDWSFERDDDLRSPQESRSRYASRREDRIGSEDPWI